MQHGMVASAPFEDFSVTASVRLSKPISHVVPRALLKAIKAGRLKTQIFGKGWEVIRDKI